MNKKVVGIICAAAVLCAAGGAAAVHFLGRGGEEAGGAVAYVDTVASWTGQGSGLGMVNRFSGVIESQETWSVNQNAEVEVEEIHVEVGDEVKEGDPLFTYNIEKYESDLRQAEIDLERMENEEDSLEKTIASLEKEKKKASSSEQANYTVQIQEQELQLKQKALDIQTKQLDIDKLKDNIEHATVTSGLTGVVKSINKNAGSSYGQEDNSFITVMRTGALRVKGSVNEQNIGDLSEGDAMLVHSRVDDQVWHGTITGIDLENRESSRNYYDSDGAQSSSYPFYVNLDDGEGLMLGQHVYLEVDLGQETEAAEEGLWLDEYLIDETDPAKPFVWADEGGKLKKREIVLGERREELMQVQVLSGLALTDSIAVPDETLKEGMKTAPMAEMYAAMEEGGMMEEGMPEEGMMEEGMVEEGGMMEGEAVMEEAEGAPVPAGIVPVFRFA